MTGLGRVAVRSRTQCCTGHQQPVSRQCISSGHFRPGVGGKQRSRALSLMHDGWRGNSAVQILELPVSLSLATRRMDRSTAGSGSGADTRYPRSLQSVIRHITPNGPRPVMIGKCWEPKVTGRGVCESSPTVCHHYATNSLCLRTLATPTLSPSRATSGLQSTSSKGSILINRGDIRSFRLVVSRSSSISEKPVGSYEVFMKHRNGRNR